jgi:PQQ-dependent catabolism-associated CXXCW motif protein
MPMGQMPMGQMPMGQMPMGQMPMGQQPMGQMPMGQQPMGQQPGMNPMMQQMMQQALMYEQQSHGVQPTDQLQLQQVHGPTPTALTGGRVVTTPELISMLQSGQRVVLVDVLPGPHPTIPGALMLPDAGFGQSFDDQVQQQLKAALDQAMAGNPATPVIFFCQGPQCWLSHNAALRAIKLGFANVGWYRGGIEVWAGLGLPTQQAGFQQQPQMMPPPQPMPPAQPQP